MTRQRKTHLRLHKEESHDQAHTQIERSLDEVALCLAKFTEATGWAIRSTANKQKVLMDGEHEYEYRPVKSPQGKSDTPHSGSGKQRWELVDALPVDSALDFNSVEKSPLVSEKSANELLRSIESLVARLEKAEESVRAQHASLATDVAIVRNKDESKEIANRLESILASSCSSVRASAAAIYILDETTSELKMRASWNLPLDRLMAPPRPLRGSLADLEALLGNAVLLEDLDSAPSWPSPEEFASALVVPIGSVSMPHGTIWYWSDNVRKYEPTQVEVANLAAGRVMNELEQSVLGAEVQQSRTTTRQLDQASVAQSSRRPDRCQQLHSHFEFDGWTLQDGMLGGAFHDWEMTPKEQLVALIGNAIPSGAQGAMVATAIQSITRTGWAQSQSPTHIMQLINDYLISGGEEDWAASATLLQIDSNSGRGTLVNAGDNQLFIVSHRGFRPVGVSTAFLATNPDISRNCNKFILQPGEVLLGMSGSLVQQLNLPMSAANETGSANKKLSDSATNQLRRHKRALAKSLDQHDLLREIREMIDEPASDIAMHFDRRLPILLNQDGQGCDRSLLVIRNNRKCV